MALSTMRFAMRPCLTAARGSLLMNRSIMPMATSAEDQMKEFWEKNQKLKRPNSPWTIYRFHLPMTTSLTHRVTGVTMGIALYGAAITLAVAPGDFCSYVEFVKALEIPKEILFPIKTVVAFPLVYHYINGIRHLLWDAGYGFELDTQYITGWFNMITSISLSAFLASLTYWAF